MADGGVLELGGPRSRLTYCRRNVFDCNQPRPVPIDALYRHSRLLPCPDVPPTLHGPLHAVLHMRPGGAGCPLHAPALAHPARPPRTLERVARISRLRTRSHARPRCCCSRPSAAADLPSALPSPPRLSLSCPSSAEGPTAAVRTSTLYVGSQPRARNSPSRTPTSSISFPTCPPTWPKIPPRGSSGEPCRRAPRRRLVCMPSGSP
ncbi:hypothetical protein C2E23DRAFT_161471 [Lenzites betulinus]|nr:hypothetical protein C2E23DRAFT_161471 [Lenzites betulinus]